MTTFEEDSEKKNLHLSNELLSKQQIIRKSNLSKYKKKI